MRGEVSLHKSPSAEVAQSCREHSSSFWLDRIYSTGTPGCTRRSTCLNDSAQSEDLVVNGETAALRDDVAMALLQPQQQQQHSWFFIDLEEDGGICEVEVDVVGWFFSFADPLVMNNSLICAS